MEQPRPTVPVDDVRRIDVFVSVHDVMPETLPAVRRTLAFLAGLGVEPVPLLVVPGKHWSASALDEIRGYVDVGHELVGHGWHHEAPVRNLYHRVHSLTISRNVAEHLDLEGPEISRLLQDCYRWFGDQGLPSPRYYVAPAWAMGRVDRAALRETSFDYFETQWGFQVPRADRFSVVPLVGFEADEAARVGPLRLFNRINRWLAARVGRLRVAIHPYDIDYALCNDIVDVLRETGAAPAVGPSNSPASRIEVVRASV